MLIFVKQYPAAISGLVEAALAVFVAFGVHLTADQSASILGVTAAVLALVVHTQVTPTVNVPFSSGGALAPGANRVTNPTGQPENVVGGPPVINPAADPPT